MMGLAPARPIRRLIRVGELTAHRPALQGDPRHAAWSVSGAVMGNDRRCDLTFRTFGPSPPSSAKVAVGAPVLRCVQIDLPVDAGRVVRIRIPWWQVGNIAIGVDLAAADLEALDPIPVIVHA